MEKRIFEIGGKEFEIKVNFRLSYNLTKYRNRVTAGFDFEDSDKEVVDEIMKLQQRVANGEEVSYSDMSSGAIEFLKKNSKSNSNLFNDEEIIDIVTLLTGIKDIKEVEDLLDKEVETNGYDILLNKLVTGIAEVFTSAKDISEQEQVNKAELIKVAGK